MILAAIILALIGAPALISCTYLLVATLLSAAPSRPAKSSRSLRFDVIIPAHNEASVIERTVRSTRKLDWPADRFNVLVIADNCTDTTAGLARAAGALVLERFNDTERGKGYALAFAFAESRRRAFADAVVVIDADAEVSPNLLESFASRIEGGAQAIQAHYGVLNPWTSWRTRLITIAKASFHIVRSRARERLGLSCGIRGNGWCLTHRLLTQVPYRAFSLTEDLEYGIDLGLAGFRVEYADEAHSDAEMVSGEQVARKQRQRWESGRFQLIRAKTFPLLLAAGRRRSTVCLDLALDLLVLPLSYVALNVGLFIVAASLAAYWDRSLQYWAWLSAGCAVSLVLYVLRGWQLSGIGAQGLLDLARAPGFLFWKLLLLARRRKTGENTGEWVRTDREKS
jgi:cellulose synthase/poly-beta-1,6-N-acetylglucosamine synthase-like glycosyltransferase